MPALLRRLFSVPLACLALALPAAAAPRYAVQDLATGEIIRRGEETTVGIAAGCLILAAQSYFRIWVFDPETGRIGYRDLFTSAAGQRFSLDEVPLRASASVDRDGDGLSDEAELVLGTSATNPDTDGDGTLDPDEDFDRDGVANLAEIAQNLNPFSRDSDGDFFWDGMELEAGTSASNPGSIPSLSVVATTRPSILRRSSALPSDFQIGAVIAAELPKPLRRASQLPADFQIGTVIAGEQPKPLRRASSLPADFQLGTVVAPPPVTVTGESP